MPEAQTFTSPRVIPTREIGYVNPYATPPNGPPSFFGANLNADEITAALMWPNNLRIYDQMCRQDSQFSGVFKAVTLPIRRTQYRVDPNGASDEVTRLVAHDLGLPIVGAKVQPFKGRRRTSISWGDHVRLALLMLRYGHMFFEQLYHIGEDGFAHLAKLSPRMPRSLMAINVAADGGLMSIEQVAPGTPGVMGTPVTIPVKRLVAYVNEREGADWTGQSLLRPAYKHWLLKDRLMRVQTTTVERNGMGVPVYTGAEGQEGSDLDAGETLAKALRSGDSAGGAIPSGATLDIKGVTGELPDAMEAINYHDQQIARAMLAHFLNLGTQSSSATGSYNLGSQFADFFSMSLQTIADQVCDVATQHIVEDLVDVNWGPDEPAPRIVCDPIGSQHEANAQAMQMLDQAGVLWHDEATVRQIHQSFGLPEPDFSQHVSQHLTPTPSPTSSSKEEQA